MKKSIRAMHFTLILGVIVVCGCATPRAGSVTDTPALTVSSVAQTPANSIVRPIAYLDQNAAANVQTVPNSITPVEVAVDVLSDLEQQANQNPTLCRLWREYEAARAKVHYVDQLPDPQIGANVFGHPIETASGSQRANLTLSQMLPWLPRLDAQAQQACFEAAALRQVYASQRLVIIGEIRASWYRLYILQKQIQVNSANQELLESLIDVATARVATGKASQGDVLAGTLEYSKLEEQQVTLRQQLVSTKAKLNRLLGREASTPIEGPAHLHVALPEWDQTMLRSLAWSYQPDIEAARIRRQATTWGVEVARLKRRPDFSVNASWFAIDDNRPTPNIVDVGKDAWAVGAMMTVPIRHEKYDAIEQEARWKLAASNTSIEEVRQRYAALIVDLWEQARSADETATLYQETIIPDAKRTLNADLEAYTNGDVEFDRVVRDFRNLLTLELGYHRSLGQLASTLSRIQQAVGVDIGTGANNLVQEMVVPQI